MAKVFETIIPAFAGLLGVGLGAGLTWLKDKQREDQEFRAAARIVSTELDEALDKIENMAAVPGVHLELLAQELKTDDWRAMRSLLARGLSPDAWREVRPAFVTLAALNTKLENRASTRRDLQQQRDLTVDRLRVARDVLRDF